jgi:hypothetical protein
VRTVNGAMALTLLILDQAREPERSLIAGRPPRNAQKDRLVRDAPFSRICRRNLCLVRGRPASSRLGLYDAGSAERLRLHAPLSQRPWRSLRREEEVYAPEEKGSAVLARSAPL